MNQINLYRILAEAVAVRLFRESTLQHGQLSDVFSTGECPSAKMTRELRLRTGLASNCELVALALGSPDLSFCLGIVMDSYSPRSIGYRPRLDSGDSPVSKNKTNKTLPPMPPIHNDHGVSPMRKKSEDQTWQGVARLHLHKFWWWLQLVGLGIGITWLGRNHP